MPCTARWPIEPPGKRRGCTTKESVDIARRPPGAVSTRAVAELVAERLDEHRVDERGRGLAARPVRERDDLVLEPGPTAAERVDPADDLGLGEDGPGHESSPVGRCDGGPQRIAHEGLRLLDPVDALAAHREAHVHIGRRRELAAVVAREPDRVHAAGAGLAEPGHEVAGAAAGGHGDGDVARPGAGDELAGEDEVEADVVAQRGEDRLVGGERPGRERLADRRPREQRDEGGDVGGAAAVAEREHPPARGEPAGHLGGGRRDQLPVGVHRGLAQRRALGGLGGGGGGEVAQQGVLVALLGVEEGVEEVRSCRSTRPIAVPAWTSRRSPGATGSTSIVIDVLDARRACAPGRGPTTSPSRPSSEQVMQTSSVHSSASVEQAGVLEADVGELPQQVVEQHEAAGGGHERVGVVEPEHVVGGTRVGPGAAADPDRRGAPGRGPAHDRADVRVGRGRRRRRRGRRAGPRSGRWRRGRAR